MTVIVVTCLLAFDLYDSHQACRACCIWSCSTSLETTDQEEEPTATTAQVARLLATMLATLGIRDGIDSESAKPADRSDALPNVTQLTLAR